MIELFYAEIVIGMLLQMTMSGLVGFFLGAVLWWIFITFLVSLARRWLNIRSFKAFKQDSRVGDYYSCGCWISIFYMVFLMFKNYCYEVKF